jgi:hypothetical protein
MLNSRSRDCDVCLVEHDDEIHAATLNIHQWFRHEVVKWLDGGPQETKPAIAPTETEEEAA